MYHCRRCGYETDKKKDFKKHLYRKIPCVANEADLTKEDFRGLYPEFFEIKVKKYQCEFCRKHFSTSQTKYIHKRICPVKNGRIQDIHTAQATARATTQAISQTTTPSVDSIPEPSTEIEKLRTEMHILQERMDRLQNPSHATPVVTQNQNQCVNIQINAFGKETTAHLTEPFLTRCVKRTNLGLIQLLERLHYDPHVKENATVRILNKKLPLAEVRDERGEWTYARKDKTLANMMDRGQEILQEHFDDNQEEIRESLSETMYDYIVKWFEKMEDKDKEVLEDVLTDIYVLVLNKSRELNKANAAYQTLESPPTPPMPQIPLTATSDASA